jgi:hypothetical protein
MDTEIERVNDVVLVNDTVPDVERDKVTDLVWERDTERVFS